MFPLERERVSALQIAPDGKTEIDPVYFNVDEQYC